MNKERFYKQLEFIKEIDRVKTIFRQTLLLDCSRKENDAEHSWHLAVLAILLQEYSAEKVDILKVVKMVLIHDIVEIDAGDTFCYDEVARQDQYEREVKAAERIFGLLPEDQEKEFRSLWDEFEARKSSEARFAAALDRFQPILHNYLTQGKSWQEHNVLYDQTILRNRPIADGAPELWEVVREMLDDAVEKGYLKK
jgi:putative hydrolase of HD superfamily